MDVTTHTNAAYTVNHDFTYDELNRLKTATAICLNDQARVYNQGYQYDLAGNMTNKTGIGGWDVLTWESAVNKPRIRPKSVRFDAEVAGIAQRNIINNQDQKPIQITYQGGTTNLYYDGAGERIKKVKGAETVIYVGGIYEVRNGQPTSYIYANGQRIVTLTNNKEYYTHSDHLGSTSIVTDETGTVVEEIGYLPFGATLFRNSYNSSVWESAYRFTGQEFDDEYQLYNYNARLYDPIMGRFITPDTIVPDPYNPQSLNRYSYCLNNPLRYTDPSGHTSITYEEWQAYMAMAEQAYRMYQIWPQMGGIMLHDFLMGFDSFQTGFEMRAVDPDTVILAQLLAGAQSSGGGSGGSVQFGNGDGANGPSDDNNKTLQNANDVFKNKLVKDFPWISNVLGITGVELTEGGTRFGYKENKIMLNPKSLNSIYYTRTNPVETRKYNIERILMHEVCEAISIYYFRQAGIMVNHAWVIGQENYYLGQVSYGGRIRVPGGNKNLKTGDYSYERRKDGYKNVMEYFWGN